KQLQAWSANCMLNFPKCLDLPTIVFVPSSDSPEYNNMNGELSVLAEEFIKLGYFVACIGNYREVRNFTPGLLYLNYKENFSIEETKKEIFKLGKVAVVLSELPVDLNKQIKELNNVELVMNPTLPKVSAEEIIQQYS